MNKSMINNYSAITCTWSIDSCKIFAAGKIQILIRKINQFKRLIIQIYEFKIDGIKEKY